MFLILYLSRHPRGNLFGLESMCRLARSARSVAQGENLVHQQTNQGIEGKVASN
jgi:hypothetical protein